MKLNRNYYHDNPAAPVHEDLVTYEGVSTGAGLANGTTIVDSNLASEPNYRGHLVKVLDGTSAGQVRLIVNDSTGGTIVVDRSFASQIATSVRFAVISNFSSQVVYWGTASSAGAADGSTIIDSSLATDFPVDDQIIGYTVVILTSSTSGLAGQSREIYDYDVTTNTLYFSPPFTAQIPSGTTYVVMQGRPSGGGGPGPTPEPTTEEVVWKLADFDNFDVADPTADTERWSSEYQVGAADGSADIHTTTTNALYVDITAAALAIAQYGVRRLWAAYVKKFLTLSDLTVKNIVADVNEVRAGIAVSRGVAWDANNYIFLYKAESTTTERIRATYRLAGAAAVTVDILDTAQDAIAFKIERENTIWRVYYSLTQSPRHHWILGAEIEDPANSLTDTVSVYLSTYNPEDAVGQRVSCDFLRWEYYETLGNLGDIVQLLNTKGGALAYLGYCPPGMVASTTSILCPNLSGFQDDAFNSGYQMIVLKNANALGSPPEMEMRDISDYVSATGTFTVEAFSANVEASDIVIVIHNSVAKSISAFGVADAGSAADRVRDSVRTEAADWWNGQQVMMLTGAARGQVRPIYDFDDVNNDILVSPDFDGVPVAGDIYVILTQYSDIVPRLADDTENELTSQVVGRKDDTVDWTYNATTSSIIRFLKGILGSLVIAEGTLTTDSATVPADTGRAEGNDYFNGCYLMTVAGAVAFQPRLIVDFTTLTGVFTLDSEHPFTAAPELSAYIILAAQGNLVPAANSTANTTMAHIVGQKADAANVTASQASIIGLLRAFQNAIQLVAGGGIGFEADGTGATLYKTLIAIEGLTTGAGTTATFVDANRTEGVDYWNGNLIVALSGGAVGQVRTIVDDDGAGTLTVEPTLSAAPGLSADYIILNFKNADWIVGANNANNAFDSSSVVENGDGSILERLEEIRGRTVPATHTITVAHGIAEQTVADITPIRMGRMAVEFDLNTLIVAVEGGTVIVRLKFMIDGATLRIIDRADFLIGTDEVHPTVSGWVIEGASIARVTIQVNSAVTAPRDIPYRIVEAA